MSRKNWSYKITNYGLAEYKNESLLSCLWDVPQACENIKSYFNPHPRGLCPACSLFGTPFYRGRVRFGFGFLANKDQNGRPQWFKPSDERDQNDCGGKLTLPLLERPRPTFAIPDHQASIPGRKIYVHHPWSVGKIAADKEIKPNQNNRTVEALATGNTFTFDIHFNHLRDWELGLLLYNLELEDNLAHKLGMGKALGLGSVQISIQLISINDSETAPESSKSALIRKGFKHLEDDVADKDGANSSTALARLRNALWLPTAGPDEAVKSNHAGIRVQYPKLEMEKGTSTQAIHI